MLLPSLLHATLLDAILQSVRQSKKKKHNKTECRKKKKKKKVKPLWKIAQQIKMDFDKSHLFRAGLK